MSCEMPTCREQDPSSCIGCPHKTKSKVDLVRGLLKSLIEKGFTPVGLERCLGLPFGTLKEANLYSQSITNDQLCSPEMIAVLKIINTFPWIVQVAERDFDEIEAKRAMMHAAADALYKELNKNDGC